MQDLACRPVAGVLGLTLRKHTVRSYDRPLCPALKLNDVQGIAGGDVVKDKDKFSAKENTGR